MRYVGIDYSMTSPCMCNMGESGLLSDCIFHYLTSVKKCEGSFLNHTIKGSPHVDYLTEQQRFDRIAAFFLDKLPGIQTIVKETGMDIFVQSPEHSKIMIEDYSFGSKGKVFHIAENTGLLKHKLWFAGFPFQVVPPTVVKKFATGKGNADKEAMYEAFVKDTGVDLNKIISPDRKLGSPVTDVVDAYYIARYLREREFAGTRNSP